MKNSAGVLCKLAWFFLCHSTTEIWIRRCTRFFVILSSDTVEWLYTSVVTFYFTKVPDLILNWSYPTWSWTDRTFCKIETLVITPNSHISSTATDNQDGNFLQNRKLCAWTSRLQRCMVASDRDELLVQVEEHNTFDEFAVAVMKNSDVVGHVPQEISKICCFFLFKKDTAASLVE